MAIKFQYNKTSLQQLEKQLKVRVRTLPIIKNKESALRMEVKRCKGDAAALDARLEKEIQAYEAMFALWNEFDASLIKEVLEYLAPKYNLYILSNGFRELQSCKMRSAGVDGYFKKVILSEDLGVLKPWPAIFNFALSATQSELRESLMIGDSWEADITGAHGVGMHQAFYNVTERTTFPFLPTYHIHSLKELMDLL